MICLLCLYFYCWNLSVLAICLSKLVQQTSNSPSKKIRPNMSNKEISDPLNKSLKKKKGCNVFDVELCCSKAYKKLAKKYHPDINGGVTNERMVRINNAFEILGNAKKRQEYDDQERARQHPFYHHGRGQNTDKGIGIQLTTDNVNLLLYKLEEPFLIYFYEQYNSQCKVALPIFEDACVKLRDMVRCAKVDIGHAPQLIQHFKLYRVPSFVASYQTSKNSQKMTREKVIEFKPGIDSNKIINEISKHLFAPQIHEISTNAQILAFLFPDYIDKDKDKDKEKDKDKDKRKSKPKAQIDDDQKVKVICLSDARTFDNRHIMINWLASQSQFETKVHFGYYYVSPSKAGHHHRRVTIFDKLGLEIEIPSVIVFSNTIALRQLFEICEDGRTNTETNTNDNNNNNNNDNNNNDNNNNNNNNNENICSWFESSDDYGMYAHSISSTEPSQIQEFVKAHQLPLVSRIYRDNFVDLAYLLEKQVLYIFTIYQSTLRITSPTGEETRSALDHVLLLAQCASALSTENLRFAYVLCENENEFCRSIDGKTVNSKAGSGASATSPIGVVALGAIKNRVKRYPSNGKLVSNVFHKQNQSLFIDNVQSLVQWISSTEKEWDANDAASISQWNSVELSFPKQTSTLFHNTATSSDSWFSLSSWFSSSFGGLIDIFSSVSQLLLILFVFMVVLPMLRIH
ncbi:hypothetical protein RFI_39782 [Reticulomyxa filosa]|uniref:J domain-containing protein n=1 Tax=Reticulomyxa filosa TaxID=46433 RepID=X6L8C7_RETFI|nr:hypothetical protein RFI_39782 [Reticulomyxa filosa]|eukprot:ETN97745.1 hypothetical protein RFI_39782 [Reticulomyxa filosa]